VQERTFDRFLSAEVILLLLARKRQADRDETGDPVQGKGFQFGAAIVVQALTVMGSGLRPALQRERA
jgi:hypothetical protein